MDAGLAIAGMSFRVLFGIGHVIDKVIQKFGKPLETIPETEITAALSEVQNTTPDSAPGSSSSSDDREEEYLMFVDTPGYQ